MTSLDHFRHIALPLTAEDHLSAHSRRDEKPITPIAPLVKAQAGASAITKQPRQAAVLIPLLRRGDRLTILLTQRSHELPQHRGQIAFPGGKIDPGDPTAESAAIRETVEEVGANSDQIEILGKLPLYQTGTGFIITPFIGYLTPPYEFEKEAGEVEQIFELPLDFMLDLNRFERRSVTFEGLAREFWALPYDGYFIWGATAAILRDLAERLQVNLHPAKQGNL